MASADNIGSKPPESIEGGGIEILERGDSVALGAAGSSTNVVTNPTSVREDSERESSGSAESGMTKMEEEVFTLKKEMERRKEEASETRAELSARKRRREEFAYELTRTSDWFQTQIRSAEAHIGRACRETSDCQWEYKREIEHEAREY